MNERERVKGELIKLVKEHWGLVGLQEPFGEELVDKLLSLKDGQGKELLVVLVDDQSLPENPHSIDAPHYTQRREWSAYDQAQQDILDKKWRRVV